VDVEFGGTRNRVGIASAQSFAAQGEAGRDVPFVRDPIIAHGAVGEPPLLHIPWPIQGTPHEDLLNRLFY
jgi:hypothetical protein